MPAVWPLVGRRGELDFIGAALGRPQGPGLVLAGRAGVGKTRLVREAVALAQRQGMAAVWGAGTESGRRIPFGALAHLLPSALPAAVSRDDVVAAAGRALRQRGGGGSLVVAVDDAHVYWSWSRLGRGEQRRPVAGIGRDATAPWRLEWNRFVFPRAATPLAREGQVTRDVTRRGAR